MAEFIVERHFQWNSSVRREGDTIKVADSLVKREIEKGKHKGTGKFISGLLNHCSPADDATEALLAGIEGVRQRREDEGEESDLSRIDQIKKEMDAMGAAYDNRWGEKRFEQELVKARKERGA